MSRPKFKFIRKNATSNPQPSKNQTEILKPTLTTENLQNLQISNQIQFIISSVGTAYKFNPNSDVLIQNVSSSSTIDITSIPASTLHIKNCRNLEIKCRVTTSVFIDSLIDCQIHVICQQLRMHESKNLQIHMD